MILRPVRPQSPWGPPMTNRPVGLMWNFGGRAASRSSAGSSGLITCSTTASSIRSWVTSSWCCVETTTVSIRTGLSPSYSTVTCDLPSGRKKSTSPLLRTAASRRQILCESEIGSGIRSGDSSVA